MGGEEGRVFRRRTHGKFVQVGLPNVNVARLLQLFNDRSIVNGVEVFQHLGSRGRPQALGQNVILNRQRNPGNQLVSANPGFINCLGLLHGPFFVQGQEGLDLVVIGLDVVKSFLGQFRGADLLVHQVIVELAEVSFVKVHYSPSSLSSMITGTRM